MHRTNEELRAAICETYEQMRICGGSDTWQALQWKLQGLVDRLAWQTDTGRTI